MKNGWLVILVGMLALLMVWRDLGNSLDLTLALWGAPDGAFPAMQEAADKEQMIAWGIRLPRVMAGLLVGAALAACGVLMQAAFHNPLASPFTLGTSSGAALGAMLAMAFWRNDGHGIPAGLFAFLGALAISLPTLVIALRRLIPMEAVLLTGVALSYAAVSMGSAMNFLSTETTVNSYIKWSLGSLVITDWEDVAMLAVAMLLPVGTCLALRSKLDAMLTGEEWALARGVNTARIRFLAILAVAVSVGISVALCGPIGFIGLMCPHMARGISGSTVSRIAITAPLLGALTLILCDYAGRNHPFGQQPVPPGVMTAAIGTPAFIILLARRFGRGQRG
jgi:iron complex transport system permease protein